MEDNLWNRKWLSIMLLLLLAALMLPLMVLFALAFYVGALGYAVADAARILLARRPRAGSSSLQKPHFLEKPARLAQSHEDAKQ